QKDRNFWQIAGDEYRARLKRYASGDEAKRLGKEIEHLQKSAKPEDKSAPQKIEDLKKELAFAKEMEAVAKEQLAEEEKPKEEVGKLEKLADDKDNKNRDADVKKLQAKKKELGYADAGDLYSRQAYRLLVSQNSLCYSCHSIGNAKLVGAKGPNLALSAERLR